MRRRDPHARCPDSHLALGSFNESQPKPPPTKCPSCGRTLELTRNKGGKFWRLPHHNREERTK